MSLYTASLRGERKEDNYNNNIIIFGLVILIVIIIIIIIIKKVFITRLFKGIQSANHFYCKVSGTKILKL